MIAAKPRHPLLTVLIPLVFLIGCGRAPAPKGPEADVTTGVTQVAVSKPERKSLVLSTLQPGRIEAFEETPLHAKVAGYVDEVLVDIGDVVQKDQVLIRLSVPELGDDLAQKEALVAQAEAEVKQAESTVLAATAAADTSQSKIAEVEAGIARVEADRDRWQSEYERIKELAAQGSVTKKLGEETSSQLKSAVAATREVQAKAQSARTASYEAQANVGKARADLGASEARLRVAQADLARARTMLSYTEIKAPYDGTVTRRNVDTGHFLQPAGESGAKPLMVVARTDTVRIFVDIPEMEAPYVDAGDPAVVRVQALTSREFTAKVVRSAWSLLESNHSLRAEIDVPNPQGVLRPGMYAVATIRLAERDNTVVVPAAAIVREAGSTFCVTVSGDKAVRKAVELGLRSGAEVEVTKGIEEDDLIVQKQPESIQDGQRVQAAAPTK